MQQKIHLTFCFTSTLFYLQFLSPARLRSQESAGSQNNLDTVYPPLRSNSERTVSAEVVSASTPSILSSKECSLLQEEKMADLLRKTEGKVKRKMKAFKARNVDTSTEIRKEIKNRDFNKSKIVTRMRMKMKTKHAVSVTANENQTSRMRGVGVLEGEGCCMSTCTDSERTVEVEVIQLSEEGEEGEEESVWGEGKSEQQSNVLTGSRDDVMSKASCEGRGEDSSDCPQYIADS